MQSSEDFQKLMLVVEDEGLIAADLQPRIERLDYPAPAIVRSGKEALQCARSTPFDRVHKRNNDCVRRHQPPHFDRSTGRNRFAPSYCP